MSRDIAGGKKSLGKEWNNLSQCGEIFSWSTLLNWGGSDALQVAQVTAPIADS